MDESKKKRRNPHVNNIISKVIDYLRVARLPQTLAEIENKINVSLSQKEDLQTIIKATKKIYYDEMTQKFSLDRVYDIYDKETLINELRRVPKGIPDNQDLKDCYHGVDKDIEALRLEKKIWSIYNDEKDKKFHVLFYKDPHDPVEIFATPAPKFLKKMWANLPEKTTAERQKMIEEFRKKTSN
jgi:hypothetical protein